MARTKILKTYSLGLEVIAEFDKKTNHLNKSKIIEELMKGYNGRN